MFLPPLSPFPYNSKVDCQMPTNGASKQDRDFCILRELLSYSEKYFKIKRRRAKIPNSLISNEHALWAIEFWRWLSLGKGGKENGELRGKWPSQIPNSFWRGIFWSGHGVDMKKHIFHIYITTSSGCYKHLRAMDGNSSWGICFRGKLELEEKHSNFDHQGNIFSMYLSGENAIYSFKVLIFLANQRNVFLF